MTKNVQAKVQWKEVLVVVGERRKKFKIGDCSDYGMSRGSASASSTTLNDASCLIELVLCAR